MKPPWKLNRGRLVLRREQLRQLDTAQLGLECLAQELVDLVQRRADLNCGKASESALVGAGRAGRIGASRPRATARLLC